MFALSISICKPNTNFSGSGKILATTRPYTSLDRTNDIIKNFPDPDKKIKVINGVWNEKDDQANAYCKYISPDTDYLWNLDSDEVYKTTDLIKIIDYLRSKNPSSVGIRSCSFFGGFNNYLTGFELKKDNFLRIFKYTDGATWLTHRPPTLKHVNPSTQQANHVDSDRLYSDTGAQMYHYSYVFPSQVYKKVNYYQNIVSKERCIDDYFHKVYLNWVLGTQTQKGKWSKFLTVSTNSNRNIVKNASQLSLMENILRQ